MGGTPLLHLLLFSSAIFLVVAQTDFLSIDCGAAKAYVDADTGIQWVPDGSYTDSGLNSNVVDQSVLQPLRTVRYFPNSSASNCYVLPINSGQKYFFRAMFYYGNYDSKNSWPSFYLSFAGNEWTSEVGGSEWLLEDAYYKELIFPARQTTSINLCFTTADWINSVPFISSLELRPLPADYYAQETVFANAYLHTLYRTYFNQEDYAVVRYDQDKIDRMWVATATVPNYANRINFTSTIDTTGSGIWNMPPPEVLAAALEGKPGYNFNYSVNLGEIKSSLLFYFYFWELRSDRNATDVREFNLVVSSDSGIRTDPLELSVGPNGTGNWAAVFWGNFGTTKSVSFSLIPTSNSTLQPILNAYEIFAYNESPVALPPPSPPPPSPSPPPPPPSPSPPPPRPRPRPGSGSGSGSALRSNTLFQTIVFGVLNFYIMLF